jgi:micrococcal nuclease
MLPAYTYAVTLHRLIDGDTAELAIDLGFHVAVTVAVRFKDVWAPERRTPEGLLAVAKMSALLRDAKRLAVRTEKAQPHQSFGRYIAEVWVDGERLADVWHGRMGEPRQGIGVA